MSRIQDILKKAERDGALHRTRGLTPDVPPVVHASPMAPAMPMPPAWTAAAGEAEEAAPRLPREQAPEALDPLLVSAYAPQSLAAEQYRSLRTRIKGTENGRVFRAMIVTSPNKGDGKTLTAANLSLTLAQEFQQRVLLLDGDLRRPSIHRLFGIAETPGLTDILMGGATLDDALVAIPEHHLTVLPAGIAPLHPAELLGSAAMRRTLDVLRTRFDRIVIDMPPIAPLADVSIAAGMADGVLMIVRAGVTPKPAIERALSGLEMSKVIGLVLNDAGGDAASSYDYSGYGYVAG